MIEDLIKTLITILGTLFITKYTCNRNVPTKEMKIAYEHIYYPILCLMNDYENDKAFNHEYFKNKTGQLLVKYQIYANPTTIVSYRNYCNAHTKNHEDSKRLYKLFQRNIQENNHKLRNRLGYLNFGIMNAYRYASPVDKAGFEAYILLSVSNILVMLNSHFYNFNIHSIIIYIIAMIVPAFKLGKYKILKRRYEKEK